MFWKKKESGVARNIRSFLSQKTKKINMTWMLSTIMVICILVSGCQKQLSPDREMAGDLESLPIAVRSILHAQITLTRDALAGADLDTMTATEIRALLAGLGAILEPLAKDFPKLSGTETAAALAYLRTEGSDLKSKIEAIHRKIDAEQPFSAAEASCCHGTYCIGLYEACCKENDWTGGLCFGVWDCFNDDGSATCAGQDDDCPCWP